jgi:hypothetical protein
MPYGTVSTARRGPDEDVRSLRGGGFVKPRSHIGKMSSPHRECVVYKRCSRVLSPTLFTY